MFSTLLRGVFFSEMNNGVACVRLPFDGFGSFRQKCFGSWSPLSPKKYQNSEEFFSFLFCSIAQ